MRVRPENDDSMVTTRHRFSDLDNVMDEVHSLFEHWEEDGLFEPLFDRDKIQLIRLAVHEWMANLVQHADFSDRTPEIILDLHPNGERVRCVIEDNSEGFDLDVKLLDRMNGLDKYPERGMGLLMLNAATEFLDYRRGTNGHHRLEFSVSADDNPWLSIPF